MAITGIILLVVSVVVLVYFVTIYNQLVEIKHNASQAWASIDALLKQRHDELPRLVETCRQFMKFERDALMRVMEARSRVATAREQQNIRALGRAESELRGALGGLFAFAQVYPDLETDPTFLQLRGRISSLENAIADRREFYNESVNVNNVRIEQFPDAIVAALLSFRDMTLLRFSTPETADVAVKPLSSRGVATS